MMYLAGRPRSWWVAFESGGDDATLFGPYPTRKEAVRDWRRAQAIWRKRWPDDVKWESGVYVQNAPRGWFPQNPKYDGDPYAPESKDYRSWIAWKPNSIGMGRRLT